ncbi:MAG: hypothetical protein H0T45_02585, partial [Pyrinomonadaceae bacterium]|nr:hypothetical protein [Pyrinomonadaceae bacterium]
LILYTFYSGVGLPLLICLALLALVPASDLAVSILNRDLTVLFSPRVLPKMDYLSGVPTAGARTMVVIPTIFSGVAAVRELLDKLEIHFLANRDEQFYFALLGDFSDAPEETLPEDQIIRQAALDGVAELNVRHARDEEEARFYVFLRRRRWNPQEASWLGWERKRGKLHEFNRLLRGATDTSYVVNTASPSLLASVKYVITLDTDTQLPRDAARKLVGAADHPLNRPQFDPRVGRVTRGYGILQPRVSISLTSAARSRFARIFSGNTGIDPYTTAVSDVYQDFFGEGIYTGKGLYDVDAFEAALAGRVPENTLLSHDLFEGLFARAALVTDIELLDDYPAHYDTYAKRQHRWTRGDWQIARWLLPRVPDANGRSQPNHLPFRSRWKIFDNLRRSLVASSILLLLAFVWLLVPQAELMWTLFVILVLWFPVYAHITNSLLVSPRGIPWTSHFWNVWGDVRTNTAQVLLLTSFIAHQAYLMLDAIGRTLYRQLISHRRLLEWQTAEQAEQTSAHDQRAFLRLMLPSQIVVLVIAGLVWWLWPSHLLLAAPFLTVWALAPFVAYRISRRSLEAASPLAAAQSQDLRLLARRTWRYYETFIGEENHWLSPDNFQEDPQPVTAHRTSPTNIGLLLLSTVAAHDFGYVSAGQLIERLERTFASLAKLPRFRGHLFNWYDTRTLAPLSPQYVSTVDSGNLAGHLYAVKQACVELPDQLLFGDRALAGLADVVALLREEAAQIAEQRGRTEAVTLKQLRGEIDACAQLLATATAAGPLSLPDCRALLSNLEARAAVVADIVAALSQEHGPVNFADLNHWVASLTRQASIIRRDLDTLTPWAAILTDEFVDAASRALPPEESGWQELSARLAAIPAPMQIPELCVGALEQLRKMEAALWRGPREAPPQAFSDLQLLAHAIALGARAVETFLARPVRLARQCDEMAEATDFRFLYDEERKVFSIGFNVTEGRRDNSYYDLLASESRLASFIAVAKGDVPQEHWFRLGRQLTEANGGRALVSWTATMFEYLMPLLVMRDYDQTLLNETYQAVVSRQIEYGAERGVPWGISESAYNARDLQLNYQYGPFGVPGLGLKRGLSDDLVITPYATVLAAVIEPQAALVNLRRLTREGALGRYGLYEAIDYTKERVPQTQKRVVVRAFMTHHQGMSLVALDNLLNRGAMQERFHADPLVQATELLLQERVPRGNALSRPRSEEVAAGHVVRAVIEPVTRLYDAADLPTPRTQLLSNGNYSVMVTTAGAGYSICDGLAVTRWREDVTRDNWGSFCYLRDVRSGAVWSAGYQPTGRPASSYEVTFAEDKVDLRRRDAGLVTHTEIIVSPEDNAEIRRVSITNQTQRVRDVELTSYAEVVLAPHAADVAHPAFSNLFIETEFLATENALIARRRPRSHKDAPVWGVHVLTADGEIVGTIQYETDRGRFLGRGHTTASPNAITEERPLSNTTGAVLDPIFSLRVRVRLQPFETARVSFSTAFARTREEAVRLADKYHDPSTFEREAALAWTKSQVEMRHLGIDAEEAHLFQRLAGRVLYSDPSLRPSSHTLSLNTETQANLWPYGIGGDTPIVLVRISEAQDLQTVRQLLRGHEYLRLKGLAIDLVILNDHPPSYAQSLQEEIQLLIRASGSQALVDQTGGVFLRRTDIIPEADRILLHAVARVVIVTERGPFDEQLTRKPIENLLPLPFVPRAAPQSYPQATVKPPELSFFNGLGGFSHGGREYVTVLGEGQWTPAPWLNVIANGQDFGFQVSETGAGYTWSVNSRENRLTPWSNDAVSDTIGEAIYLRDEETGTVWSPTPLPIRETESYTIRHGQGYSVFEHVSHGISQELLMFVPLDAPVKVSLLRLRNLTERKRRLSITTYSEWVLGVQRGASTPYVITEIDEASGAVFARNPYNNEFTARVAFADLSEQRQRSATCDRKEFLGRNGSHARPAALRRQTLSGRAGAGLDACAAIQAVIELEPNEARETIILIGEGASHAEARAVLARFKQTSKVYEAFEQVVAYWDQMLGTVEVKTPDPALDVMLNRWLPYQALACRVWSRSAFYQSGGAYGFRDQLQDVMSLVYARPELVREQILRAAGRQFPEGDV